MILMRILDFLDGFFSESVPSQGAATANALPTFVDDAAYVTAKGSAAAAGDLYFNTTSNVQRNYDGTAWVNTVLNSLVSAQAANYTVLDTDNIRTVLVTSGGTDKTITLPSPATNVNRVITVSKVDTGAGDAIVAGTGPELNYTMSLQNESVTFQTDGTNWIVLSKHVPSVAVRYSSSASQSIPNVTYEVFNFDTKEYDTANNGTDLVTPGVSWIFTAPKDGYYSVTSNVNFSSGTNVFDGAFSLFLYKNAGSLFLISESRSETASASFSTLYGSATALLQKGDEIDLRIFQGMGVARTASNSGSFVWVTINLL